MTTATLITLIAYFLILRAIGLCFYKRNESMEDYLLGMATGTVVLIVWKQMGPSERRYEIVPGSFVNLLVILVVRRIAPQEDARVLQQFDEVTAELRGRPAPVPAFEGTQGG